MSASVAKFTVELWDEAHDVFEARALLRLCEQHLEVRLLPCKSLLAVYAYGEMQGVKSCVKGSFFQFYTRSGTSYFGTRKCRELEAKVQELLARGALPLARSAEAFQTAMAFAGARAIFEQVCSNLRCRTDTLGDDLKLVANLWRLMLPGSSAADQLGGTVPSDVLQRVFQPRVLRVVRTLLQMSSALNARVRAVAARSGSGSADPASDGVLDFVSLASILLTLTRTSFDERLHFVFDLCCAEGTDELPAAVVCKMISELSGGWQLSFSCAAVSFEILLTAVHQEHSLRHALQDGVGYLCPRADLPSLIAHMPGAPALDESRVPRPCVQERVPRNKEELKCALEA